MISERSVIWLPVKDSSAFVMDKLVLTSFNCKCWLNDLFTHISFLNRCGKVNSRPLVFVFRLVLKQTSEMISVCCFYINVLQNDLLQLGSHFLQIRPSSLYMMFNITSHVNPQSFKWINSYQKYLCFYFVTSGHDHHQGSPTSKYNHTLSLKEQT